MALATRCPNCQVLFRVVADQLKLRGGLVRCGSCRHVFDAIGSLAYVDDAAMPAPVQATVATKPHPGPLTLRITPGLPPMRMPAARAAAPAPTASSVAAPSDVAARANGEQRRETQSTARARDNASHTSAHEDNKEQSRSGERSARPSHSERESGATGVPTLMAGAPATGDTDPGEDGARKEETGNDDAPRRQRARAAAKARAEAKLAKAVRGNSVLESGPGTLDEEDLEPEFLRRARTQRGYTFAFAGGAALLLALLLVQLALVFRTELISRWPGLRPTLSQLCEVAGCTVSWPTRAELLAVVGSELQAIPGTDILELTAVIRNRAAFKVALPALEVALTDTSNRTLARKVFEPVDYLTSNGESGSRIGEGLGPGSDYTVHIVFEARGLAAAGFVVYPFYL